ncbi:MAG: phage major capsid protein [Smithellaceae bacterium]|nr:phage major capsid protein [Smithellaceae bacterium]
MGPIALTDIDGLLKDVLREPIVNQINKETMILNQIEAGVDDFDIAGETIKHPVMLTRNTKMGFRQTGAYMPSGGNAKVKQVTSNPVSLYAYVEFEGQAIRRTLNQEGAFEKLLQFELKNAAESCRMEINRASYGFGRGDLGILDGAPVGNVITVESDTIAHIAPNMSWFEEGMELEAYDAATLATRRGTYVIDTISPDTREITLVDSTGLQDGDYLFVNRNKGNEPMGFLGFADNGTYVPNLGGVSETDFHRWNGHVDTAVAVRAITEEMLQNMITKIERAGQGQLIMTTEAIRNKIARLIKSTMVQPQTLDLKGGFKALSYNGYPIWHDIYAPYGTILHGIMQYVKIHQAFPQKDKKFNAFMWDDLDGSILHGVRDTDVFWAKSVMDYNLTTKRRNAFGRIDMIDANL